MYKILSVSLFTCLAFMGTQDAFAGKQKNHLHLQNSRTPQDMDPEKNRINLPQPTTLPKTMEITQNQCTKIQISSKKDPETQEPLLQPQKILLKMPSPTYMNKPVQTTSMKPRISFKKKEPSSKSHVGIETVIVSTFNGLKWEINHGNSENTNLDIACEKMRNMDIRD